MHNSTSNEFDHVYSQTESNTLHNIECNIKVNSEKKQPLQEVEENNSHVKCHKRRHELLNTDKGKHINYKILHLQTLFIEIK